MRKDLKHLCGMRWGTLTIYIEFTQTEWGVWKWCTLLSSGNFLSPYIYRQFRRLYMQMCIPPTICSFWKCRYAINAPRCFAFTKTAQNPKLTMQYKSAQHKQQIFSANKTIACIWHEYNWNPLQLWFRSPLVIQFP